MSKHLRIELVFAFICSFVWLLVLVTFHLPIEINRSEHKRLRFIQIAFSSDLHNSFSLSENSGKKNKTLLLSSLPDRWNRFEKQLRTAANEHEKNQQQLFTRIKFTCSLINYCVCRRIIKRPSCSSGNFQRTGKIAYGNTFSPFSFPQMSLDASSRSKELK